jgi:hypothetical protein
MSASFFAFSLAMMSFDIPNLPAFFSGNLPVKLIGGFLLLGPVVFGLMWIGKIVPPLINNKPPQGIEHYTTLVIQALDLGFVVPVGIVAGILLIQRKPFGYLLAPVIIIKEITLLTALTAMIFMQIKAGIEVSSIVIVIVTLFNLLVIYCLYVILKNIEDDKGDSLTVSL